VRRAETDAAQAERERVRVADLVAKKFMSDQALEQADVSVKTKAADLKAAKSRAVAAAADVEAARATLVAVRAKAPTVRVASPVNGSVLRIAEKSERVVQPGTVLVTVGDPAALEIVVDVLSNDAVRVKPGMRMLITGWGGPEIEAAVRRVEPAAFKKISALGVEEQRVNVIGDFKAVPPGIGDAYRLDARFVVDDGRLAARGVELGLRGARDAEITAGLSEKEEVVLYPGNDLADGARVHPRQ
jgi:HlyD family secretion protein